MRFPVTEPQTDVRIFGAASRYVQGPGALDLIGTELARVGKSCLVLIDVFLFDRLQPRIAEACSAAGVATACRPVSSEVTEAGIAAAADGVPADIDVVVGVGGGKTIDIAKGVSRMLGVAVVTVPTIASNDSPASRAIALYNDDHQLREVPLLARNPALVLVDTAVIAQAPARFLAAGIGDALSKHFEVEACRAAGGHTMQGTRGLRVASVLAAGCYRILREESAAALASHVVGRIDQAFEDTVEAVILLSGLAFENGGLSIAHAATRGLMAVPGAASKLHGEHVAYGLLMQLALTGASNDEIMDVEGFLASIGLPRSLRDLGAAPSEEVVGAVANGTLTAPHVRNVAGVQVDHAALVAAILRVERLVAV